MADRSDLTESTDPTDSADGTDGDEPAGGGRAERSSSDPVERARDEFEVLVERAIAAIPSPFAEGLSGVAILVEDEPASGQAPPGQVLLGLYEGVPRTAWGADGSPYPSRITIFRRAHELMFPDPEARARAVESTVLHEVAHHFGTDEERIREIEAGRRRPRRP